VTLVNYRAISVEISETFLIKHVLHAEFQFHRKIFFGSSVIRYHHNIIN
jgi:hypothetical protein